MTNRFRWRGETVLALSAAFGICALSAAFRFLATQGFGNDHYVHLAGAQQILAGDWPTRDFLDPGLPLMFLASAGGQWLLGKTLFADAVLVSVAFGLAAALTFLVVRALTGSWVAAVGAAFLEVAAFPHSYGYPKVLVTAAGLWSIGLFVRHPDARRVLAVVAFCVVTGFLFRHDLGIYVGVGAVTASLLVDANDARWKRTAYLLALIAILIAPYLLYVQMTAGLREYLATGMDLSRQENVHVWPNPFVDTSSPARLQYVLYLLPAAALVLAVKDIFRRRNDWRTVLLIAAAVVGLLESFGLVRDHTKERVPDAIVPAVVVGAWLMHRALRGYPWRYSLVPVLSACLVFGAWVWDLGDMTSQVERAGLLREEALSKLPGLFEERSSEMRERFGAHQLPSHAVEQLIPVFPYLDRCTADNDHLFLFNLPEVTYFARRPFGGGAYNPAYYTSESNQRRVVRWLQTQRTPFAFLRSDYADDFDRLTIVAEYVRNRYVPLTDVPVDDWQIHVLVDRTLAPVAKDEQTGWPCFRVQRETR
jgi:hypothetical protein